VVRWYVGYALSLRNREMMQERGLFVDHSTIDRRVINLVPVLQEAFRKRERKRCIGAVGKSWRLDETYIKIGGEDRYWYRLSQIDPGTAPRPLVPLLARG
jgi:putative transposase